MIDLNDVWPPPPRIDLAAVKAQLAATAADWLPDLFPQARLVARPAGRCAAPTSRAGRRGSEGSCVLHLDGPYAGWGFDFATGERAGPIDLIYHATGLTDGALFEEAARLARMDRPVPPRAGAPKVGPHAARSAASSTAAGRSPARPPRPICAAAGCRTRHRRTCCSTPTSPTTTSARGWPGMVAVPRRADGAPVGGIHRTFLLDDGSAKAPPGKKMLGSVAGRRGAAVPDRRRRSPRHRRGHRDRARRAGDLRRADLGRALRRRPAPLAVAGRA